MALSGTLETFSLHDVLQLLSSTDKVGLLSLTGDRGRGHVWVERGMVVQASTDHAGAEGIAGALFDLLRFTRGSFSFEAEVTPTDRGTSALTVEAALEAAETLLAEWREIESVVPSLSVAVHLSPEIQTAVSVKPAHWRVLARVGSGATAATLADGLDLLELDMCRMLRDMVESGMVEIAELDSATESSPAASPFVAPAFAASTIGGSDWSPPETIEPDAVADDETRSAYAWSDDDLGSPSATGTDDPSPALDVPTDADDLVVDVSALDAVAEPVGIVEESPAADVAEAEPVAEPVAEESADDFLAQLANLSPRAAAAIEAVEAGDVAEIEDSIGGEDAGGEVEDEAWAAEWEAPTSAPADQPASDDGGSDDGNSLLLRFLSSNKS